MNNAVKMMVAGRMGEHHDEEHEPRTAHGSGLPFEKFAKLLMNGEAFIAYVKKHGYHFTPALADHVTRMMVNDDGSAHHWNTADVEAAMLKNGWKSNPLNFTWGDASYIANMSYADAYPEVIMNEMGCLRNAYKMANDADGYEGMAFARWLSDVVAKEIVIDWEAFI